ncbi:hypothetical protein [Nitrosomonas communis]|nr:hypothetical protein [Nitrosomonas communis]
MRSLVRAIIIAMLVTLSLGVGYWWGLSSLLTLWPIRLSSPL